MRIVVIVGVCAALLGCGRGQPESRPAGGDREPERSTGAVLVDGVTGRGAVRAGKKARAVIEAVSAEKKRDMDAVLEE